MDKVIIASDHAGYNMKTKLIEYLKGNTQVAGSNIEVFDIGPDEYASVDYPYYACRVAKLLSTGLQQSPLVKVVGILVCGTGQGMAMTANRYKNIRAVVCYDADIACKCRQHNHANVLCLGSRVVQKMHKVIPIVDAFLNTKPSTESRHLRRVDLIELLS